MSPDKSIHLAFPDKRTHWEQVFPGPEDGSVATENPPVLVWLPPVSEEADFSGMKFLYHCTVMNAQGEEVFSCDTRSTVACIDHPLKPGAYNWDVSAPEYGIARGQQRFVIPEDAISWQRPSVETVLQGLPDERPRHLFTKREIPEILASHKEEVAILKRNIEQAYLDGLPERPMFHTDEDALPYREYFGRFRDFCDRNLVACCLGYSLLGDEKAGVFARKLFLHICDWNPEGPCALYPALWGDEVGLSCARCFPAVFDMLYPLLSEKERKYAGAAVAAYALQCEKRINAQNYELNPGNSHTGRLPAYLGEAALSLWGCGICDEAVLKKWLDKALGIYNGIFPYFGGADGSWAEGTFYSTSYTKWYLPFFSAVSRYSGRTFLERPFFRNYARFLLHFALPDHEIHPFGDGYWCTPDSQEWPGFFAQNPFRIYAGLSGLPEAMEMERKLAMPELFYLHLLDIFLPQAQIASRKVRDITDADAFLDAGYVSLHSDHTAPQTDLHLMAKASKFGPGSHRQPDNGSFSLFSGGTALLCPSGYFGRECASTHHMKWYNTTKAHNAILVDGVGQNYFDFRHTGKIVSCAPEEDGSRKAVLDLTESYPMLKEWVRTLTVVDRHTAVIEDMITAEREVTITYALHTLSPPRPSGEGFTVIRQRKTMEVIPEPEQFISRTISDQYDVDLNADVPAAYHVTMPQQYHVYFETASKKAHHLRVVIKVH